MGGGGEGDWRGGGGNLKRRIWRLWRGWRRWVGGRDELGWTGIKEG